MNHGVQRHCKTLVDLRMKTSKDPFKQHINARNAKKVATCLVIGFIVYHGILHVSYHIDSCKWLLTDGKFQGYHVWQPYGCMLHNYSKTDTRMCMQYIAYWGGHNSFVFMGDSRIRHVFTEFVKHVAPRSYSSNFQDKADLHMKEPSLKVDLQFLWRPILNSSVSAAYQSWLEKQPTERPKMVVTGCATSSIRENNATEKSLEDYKTNLTRLLSAIDALGSGTDILWVLQDPVVEENLPPESAMITNEQIDLYNEAAVDVLRYTSSAGVHIWRSSRLISSHGYGRRNDDDGLDMSPLALEYSVQILLNMYCNNQMSFNDGTCCADPEKVTGLQMLTFCTFFIVFITAASLVIYRRIILRKYQSFTLLVNQEEDVLSDCYLLDEVPESSQEIQQSIQPKDSQAKSYYELLTCLTRIGLIMAYAFLCDRTNFFMKENKYYTAPNFFLPIAYVFGLGLFFTEESKHTRVLHRNQTDEWKGWMQLVILTYHMTGANQVMPIYVFVRLLMSTYLFLLGFGHFSYYWQRGDHGFHRLWKVSYSMTRSDVTYHEFFSWVVGTSRSIGRTGITL